jgi:hypothetical protein
MYDSRGKEKGDSGKCQIIPIPAPDVKYMNTGFKFYCCYFRLSLGFIRVVFPRIGGRNARYTHDPQRYDWKMVGFLSGFVPGAA